MRQVLRTLLRLGALPAAVLLLAAAAPDTFTREQLNALEAEKQAAERKLAALQASGDETLRPAPLLERLGESGGRFGQL